MCAQQIVHRNKAYINETIRCIRDQLTLCGSCMLIYLYINLRSRDGTFVRPSGVQRVVVVIHSVCFGQVLR